MNTTDSIIPGLSAAGFRLGERFVAPPGSGGEDAAERFHGICKYTFPSVTVWVKDGLVNQIGVRAPYTGTLEGGIGIGSTIAMVQSAFGAVGEDENDSLIVRGSSGWCFETDSWVAGKNPGANRNARIAEIFVFSKHG